MDTTLQPITDYKYGFRKPENYVFKTKKGLSKRIVEEISWYKNEPKWMLDFRLKSLGNNCEKINFPEYLFPRSGFGSSLIPIS